MLSEKEITSLARMLDDPDESISINIIDQLINSGKSIFPILESVWEFSLNPLIEERISQIKQNILEREALIFFTQWNLDTNRDIISAWIFLSELFTTSIDKDKVLDFINKLRFDAWIELNENLTTMEKCNILIQIFQSKHQLKVLSTDVKKSPDQYLLNKITSDEASSRTSIAIIFQHVAKQLDIQLIGLNYFEYAILGYLNPGCDKKNLKREDVLFYVVFAEKITIITNRQLDLGLNIDNPSLYTPATDPQILLKILYGLQISFTQESEAWKASVCKKIMSIFAPKK